MWDSRIAACPARDIRRASGRAGAGASSRRCGPGPAETVGERVRVLEQETADVVERPGLETRRSEHPLQRHLDQLLGLPHDVLYGPELRFASITPYCSGVAVEMVRVRTRTCPCRPTSPTDGSRPSCHFHNGEVPPSPVAPRQPTATVRASRPVSEPTAGRIAQGRSRG
jgi:hypothetical protein